MNSTELKDEIILYGGDEVAEIGEDMDAFMVWLGAALVNRHEDVCVFQNMWESDSFSFSYKRVRGAGSNGLGPRQFNDFIYRLESAKRVRQLVCCIWRTPILDGAIRIADVLSSVQKTAE
uniref:Uncharacterized protein n=1 Tax=uncultured marine virus TaxID=186617 RepID=A0A0F7L2K8_9VIRU|nr:hypothetical protein [uncultured marine virus]